MRIFRYLVVAYTCLSFISYANANDTSGYGSLKEFCIAEEKDTGENCECGQATANIIMSPQEQAVPLALMQGVSQPVLQTTEKHDAFMDKLSQITKGCTKQHHSPKNG